MKDYQDNCTYCGYLKKGKGCSVCKGWSQKVYFSSTDTENAWTGGGYYQIVWQLDIFKWHIFICLGKQYWKEVNNMKVTRRFNQHRRDLSIDLECEGCGAKDTYNSAYDDRNFWDNVVPNFKCKKCNKSTKDLGIKTEVMPTRYADYEIV